MEYSVCVCDCVTARARVCVCVCVCVIQYRCVNVSFPHIFVCMVTTYAYDFWFVGLFGAFLRGVLLSLCVFVCFVFLFVCLLFLLLDVDSVCTHLPL